MADSKKRCLYEILNLPRDCSQEEIRSAYRRLALQLHPDKNPNSSPAAFQELQHAYEVLSDPKERQFYDSHRSQILFSNANSSSSGSSSSFFDLDLFSYFSTSAFSGFGDTGKGFFKVYGEVFSKIYAQELFFVKELGLDPDLVRPAPLIGNLESPYSQVTAFYNYWLGFCTVLDFGWVDEYDVALGPNRRSRRAMEEENKKKRKKARREYTDLVRDLAAFVKKRDKRVMDMQLKKSLEEEKRREEEKKRKKEEERKKMERARMYEEPEWAKIDGEEDRVFEEVAIDEDDNKGKKEEFYCVVCNKKFKSDKQWKNHEQSKKHRDKVAELRISFQKEEEEEEEDEYFESLDDCETEKQDDVNVVDDLCEEFEEDVGLEERVVEDRGHDGDELGSDDETSILEAMVSGHKNRKRNNVIHDDLTTDRGSFKSNGEESSLDSDTGKGQRNQAASEGIDITANAEYRGETTDSKDNEAGVEIRESSLDSDTGKGRRNQAASDGIDITANAEYRRETTDNKDNEAGVENREENAKELDEDASQSRDKHVREHEEIHFTSSEGVFAKGKGDQAAGKKHKKQQVDARGTVKKETNTTKSSSKGKKQKGGTKAPSNSCETCGQSFDTRNKLFAHLGDTGHAILKLR